MNARLLLAVVAGLVWTGWISFGAADDAKETLQKRFDELDALSTKNPEKAAKPLEELLDKVRTLDPDSVLESRIAATLGAIAQDRGKFQDAERHFQRCLAIVEKKQLQPYLPTALYNLAKLYLNQSKYDEAKPLLEKCRAATAADDPVRAYAIDGLAQIHLDFGEFGPAEALLKESLKLREPAKDAADLAASFNYLGLLCLNRGQYAAAQAWYDKSLKLVPDDPAVLHNLGDLYQSQDDFVNAASYYEKSLKIRAGRPNRPELAKTQHSLANVYAVQERFEEAKDLLDRCLEIRKLAAPESVEVAVTLNSFGRLYYLQGDYELAKKHYRASLKLHQRHFPADHPQLSITRNNLALVLAAEGRVDEAAREFDQVRRGVRPYIVREVPIKPGPEQQRFLDSMKNWSLDHALSLGYWNLRDAKAARNSAAWLLNGKAVVHEALAEAIRVAHDQAAVDDRVRTLSTELQKTRKAISRLSIMAGRGAVDAARHRALTDRENELAVALRTAGNHLVAAKPWVELDEVVKHLPADAALVEVARLRPYPFKARGAGALGLPERYLALVIRPDRDVRLFDLGEAARIDKAVRNVRAEMADESSRVEIIRKFEDDEERTARARLTELADLLAPLLADLKTVPRWIISPDGALWLAPWEALPVGAAYAIEKHTISYVATGRELIPTPRQPARNAPLVIGDPDFDWQVGPGPKKEGKPVAALPGAAQELQNIAAAVGKYAGEPRVLKRERADSSALRNVAGPRVLVLSTHGYFEPPAKPNPAVDRPGDLPLLRCGILLAGCNRATKGTAAEDTGVMLGLDILDINLRGTELVVLSACETGVVDVYAGEGVASMRQAFQLAGAENVVASLWNAVDDASALLMRNFFDNLANGQPRAAALRNAQLATMREHRHPTFWAAFTIMGKAN